MTTTLAMLFFQTTAYGWLMLAGIFVSIVMWSRLAKYDEKLVLIYIAALAGAFLGAKVVYLSAEGWLHWHDGNFWVVLATGKSITGALLGGYAGVEIIKRLLGYTRATGDWFALIAPIGIMLGRVGCVLHGCCLGRECGASWFTVKDATGTSRWPAAQAELVFNALALGVILFLRGRARHPVRAEMGNGSNGAHEVTRPAGGAAPPESNYLFAGQHFHLYLIAYGLFRFGHEFLRATPQIVGPFSGYHFAALAVAGLGLAGFVVRRKQGLASAAKAA